MMPKYQHKPVECILVSLLGMSKQLLINIQIESSLTLVTYISRIKKHYIGSQLTICPKKRDYIWIPVEWLKYLANGFTIDNKSRWVKNLVSFLLVMLVSLTILWIPRSALGRQLVVQIKQESIPPFHQLSALLMIALETYWLFRICIKLRT